MSRTVFKRSIYFKQFLCHRILSKYAMDFCVTDILGRCFFCVCYLTGNCDGNGIKDSAGIFFKPHTRITNASCKLIPTQLCNHPSSQVASGMRNRQHLKIPRFTLYGANQSAATLGFPPQLRWRAEPAAVLLAGVDI